MTGHDSGKKTGGGLCAYVTDIRALTLKYMVSICHENIEYLALSFTFSSATAVY